ncbi:MAG: sialate O-acetylesterase [Candidatus Pedobacter colombiensis]|uniref:Sialate O-acetylesterase n=1 Tax=Candidatus Pedobacter colombiensis TaxID=3121371 RepID=A0AAJ5W744_9SPHI|nr:sialate O-acetylesterase [Pedobacter sp.]WEK17772.1 MAG: sialate O-acetylesterase [Pedobacter sp.]
MIRIFITAIFTVLLNSFLFAKVKLPKLVSDGMVLQRDTPIKIWGWADRSEKIDVRFQGKQYNAIANNQGEWEITLPAQKAGGPVQIQINNIIVKDILFGDVWLCSGQSNMDLPINRVLDLYKKEIENVENNQIRLFLVPTAYDFQKKQSDLKSGEWKAVTPKNVLDFSATAYFFAQSLYEKYKVPIGLLKSSQGGTRIECWVSDAIIRKYPAPYETFKTLNRPGYIDSVQNVDKMNVEGWNRLSKQNDEGIKGGWKGNETDFTGWTNFKVPGFWAETNIGAKNGVFWLKKEFEVNAPMIGKEGILRLGTIVDSDSAFVNGTFVGTTYYQYPPRIYKVPANVLKPGKNILTIRIVNSKGKGGLTAGKQYSLEVEDKIIDLKGDWKLKIGTQMQEMPNTTTFQNGPVGLYNSMISPLEKYSIKGFVWYQGESNAGNAKAYAPIFKDLISSWRVSFNNENLPFLYVQLPNFGKAQTSPAEKNSWADFREMQRNALEIPNTAMAVTIDVGEWNDIHPLNKKTVGSRLALLAQKVAYNEKNIVSSGPLVEKMEVKDGKCVLQFQQVGKGLTFKDELKGFVIAGEDGVFKWAQAKVIATNKVLVWSDDVKNPTMVRYAWAGNPVSANLRNDTGLPASPFEIKN